VALNGTAAGTAGTAIGNVGTVYAQVNDTVLAFASKTLEPKGSFTAPEGKAAGGSVTPVVITWHEKDAVVAGTQDGRLFLLDAAALDKPLASTESMAAGGFRGAFAGWMDPTTSTHWIYAATTDGMIGFRLEEQGGQPVFTKAWTSKSMDAPAPPVTANGLVFALATGNGSKRAVLSALDGATGSELYSSGTMASTWVHGSGLAVANKRIYFTTHDNTVYCLGFFVDQPQLTGR
jgi:outer membrane protein assembly factor BamB